MQKEALKPPLSIIQMCNTGNALPYKFSDMIDYIKVKLTTPNISELKNNKYLNFIGEFDEATGEVIGKGTAKYKGITFSIYQSGSVFISGSLHKYWNNGKHNYNDFKICDILEVLQDIQNNFNIKPYQMVLKCIEIGVNITSNYKTDKILQHCFFHSTESFKWCKVQNDGNYIQAEHSQYLIKIYNKAMQYKALGFDIKKEILRFEIKYRKMEKFKKMGIVTLQDFLDFNINNCVSFLVNEWQRVLFYDFTIQSNTKSLSNYKNPLYWQELTERNGKASFKKHRQTLSNLIQDCSKNIPQQIAKLIEEKGNKLSCKGIQIDQDLVCKNRSDFPVLESLKKEQGIQIDPLVILSKQIPSEKGNRTCQITGLPLHQQKESILLSHTGLYYYLNNYPEVFRVLKKRFLSDLWIDSSIDKQVKEIAHNIRNTKSNIERKQKRLYPADQYRLFATG